MIVTGGARGIGKACALEFARHGASVVVADVLADEARAVAAEIEAETQSKAIAVGADVSRRKDCRKILERCVQAFQRCHILLNNAGIVRSGSVLDVSPEDFDAVLAVNVRGMLLLSQIVARQMVERGIKGSIINMSSTNAVVAIPTQLSYVASKGAVLQMTKAMALGLAEHDIRVNAIGPGSIATAMFQSVADNPKAIRTVLSRTPLGRPGTPAEVGKVAVFLASDYASYLTGETIYPDGGRLALNYTVPLRGES